MSKIKTILALLRWAANKLKNKSASALLDAEVLLSSVVKKPRELFYARSKDNLTRLQIAKYKRLIARRTQGEPVAYLTGHKEFYGLDFIVDKHVLTPRPETELMVEEAKKKIINHELRTKNKKLTLVDIGTGSGCIPIAILKTTKLNNETIHCLAVDISGSALKVAKQNAKHHRVKIKFFRGDLFKPIFKTLKHVNIETKKQNNKTTGRKSNNIIITANLPYLTASQIKNEPSIRREPRLALDGGKNGLGLYKKLLQQIKILNTKYQILNAFFEIDPSQSRRIISLIKKNLPQARAEIKKDLSGRNRLVIIETQLLLSKSPPD